MEICPNCRINDVDEKCKGCGEMFCQFCLITYHIEAEKLYYCKSCEGKLEKCETCKEKYVGKSCQRCGK